MIFRLWGYLGNMMPGQIKRGGASRFQTLFAVKCLKYLLAPPLLICPGIMLYKYYSPVLYWKSLSLKEKFSVLETSTLKIEFSVLGTLIFTRKSPVLGTLSLTGKFPVLGTLGLAKKNPELDTAFE